MLLIPFTYSNGLSEPEAIERFGLKNRLERYGVGARIPDFDAIVEVVEGDLFVAGDLLVDWPREDASCPALRASTTGSKRVPSEAQRCPVGLIVLGRLIVSGAIVNANLKWGPFLLVEGTTEARAIFAGGAEFRFEGKVRTTDAVVGCDNDSVTRFAGGLDAPIVISRNHEFDIHRDSPPYFDAHGGEGDIVTWAEFFSPRARLYLGQPNVIDLEEHILPLIQKGERIVRDGFGR